MTRLLLLTLATLAVAACDTGEPGYRNRCHPDDLFTAPQRITVDTCKVNPRGIIGTPVPGDSGHSSKGAP